VLKLSQRYSKQSRYWEFSFSFQNCAHGSISHRTSDIRDFSCTLENKKTLHESTLDVLKDAGKHYHQLGYAGSVAILKTAIALSLLNQTQLRAVGRRRVSVVAFPHNCNPCCSDPLALAAPRVICTRSSRRCTRKGAVLKALPPTHRLGHCQGSGDTSKRNHEAMDVSPVHGTRPSTSMVIRGRCDRRC
jgi:hypothetical protein